MFNSKDWNHDHNSEQWKEIKNVNAIHDLNNQQQNINQNNIDKMRDMHDINDYNKTHFHKR